MLSVGVIGVGGWGKHHLRVLNDLGALAGFCDTDPLRLKKISETYDIEGRATVDEFLRETNLDAVIVSTPTSTHYDMASKVINFGLPVLVEKPLTYNAIEGEKLIKLAAEQNVFLTVGYIERFNPAVRELKAMLDRGETGDPLLLEFHRENRRSDRVKDVGVVMDTAVHDIDTARWIFGNEPNVIFARTGKVIGEHEDFATLNIGFKGERTAFISSNWVTPKRVRTLAAVCTKSIVEVDFISQELRVSTDEGTRIPNIEPKEPLKVEVKTFIDSVSKGGRPAISGRDALNTTKVAEAALISSQTGAPIYLDL